MEVFFAGSQSPESNEFILKNNYNRLASYVNDRSLIIKWFKWADEYNWTGKFFLDSGAFSALTQGITIDIYKYIDFVNTYCDKLYCFANLDVIPGKESNKSLEQCCEEGFQNFLTIQKHCNCPEKCCAVYHQGEPLQILYKYIEYYKQHKELKFIGLGGVAGAVGDSVFYFLEKCCRIIKKHLPYVRIHLFGYTKLQKLRHINGDTADSTTWIMVGANGRIMSPYGTLSVSDKLKNTSDSIYHLHPEAFKVVNKEIEDAGYTLEELSTNYKKRCNYNIQYLHNAVRNIVYKTIPIKKSLLEDF